MTHIKRLTIQGFKSFANKTDVHFDTGINTVVGPNGSGKSNISDALCFALGRLSVKSMRAAKAKNLLFMGTKSVKPAKEASVELVFDNVKKTFNLPVDEVAIKRIVKHSGQSVYKINNETKTRSDVIETLAQAGIDPYGFNIILQGNIQGFVRIHPEERRKVIEEVAGISIYESRKEKSLKELEKTEARLKEISAVLRERTSFLKNLERERAQALRFKELESTVKRCKASIISKKADMKSAELKSIKHSIDEKTKQRDAIKEKHEAVQKKIESLNEQIAKINKHIQQSSGIEQETLHEAITNVKAELEGLRVRKENYENRRAEIKNRIEQMQTTIPEYEAEIAELRKESPLMAKKQEELQKKKNELAQIEEERKNVYRYKTELAALKDRVKDKSNQLARVNAESDSLLKQIEEQTISLQYADEEACKKIIEKTSSELQAAQEKREGIGAKQIDNTRLISAAEAQIAAAEKIKKQINEIDTCPLCQNTMTEEHVSHVNKDSDEKIAAGRTQIADAEKAQKTLESEKQSLIKTIQTNEKTLADAEKELAAHSFIKDKQNYLKKLLSEEKILKQEVQDLENKREGLEKKTVDVSRIEEQYSTKMLEIEEISSRTEKDLDTTLLYKERELEKLRDVIKRSAKDVEEIQSELEEITETISEKSDVLEKREEEERQLNEKFKKLFKERDDAQDQVQKENYNSSTVQNEIRQIEDQINYLKVGNAKVDAEFEALHMELKDYVGVEIIKASITVLQDRLQKSQNAINSIGSINMRALEVYDEIKNEYDKVREKVETVEAEKDNILKIIEEIDRKKKRTFMKTFKGINELFSRNFSQLSSKGHASLEIENKEDIFAGGIAIAIKMGKGKYFDVTSLSGGEQTLIALSLLFAIQEFKPHHFYIFDEIDAALDKRNSERLSGLLKQYMKNGQYIVVTHNDAIITDSNFLYGVSMHEGVSKILSLKLD